MNISQFSFIEKKELNKKKNKKKKKSKVNISQFSFIEKKELKNKKKQKKKTNKKMHINNLKLLDESIFFCLMFW